MLTTLPQFCAIVMKSGNLNFLEPSGLLRACNGTALPLPLQTTRKENNWKTEETLERAVVTLETERI